MAEHDTDIDIDIDGFLSLSSSTYISINYAEEIPFIPITLVLMAGKGMNDTREIIG